MARTKWSMHGIAGAVALAMLAAGCAGSDGAQGPQGTQGAAGQDGARGDPGNAGTTGPVGPIGPPNYNPYTADEAVATVTTPVTVSGSNVVVYFNVKVGGVNRNDFIEKASAPGGVVGHNEDAWWVYDATAQAGARTKIDPTTWVLASKGNGNYTATISGLPAAALANGTAFMLSTRGSNSETATVVAFLGPRTHDTVGDEACVACHGAHIWRGAAHDVTNPYGVGPCVICHNRTGSADRRLPGAGSGLMGIAHGIHNSTNMAAGMNVDIDPAPATTVKNANDPGHFVWTWTNGNEFDFSVGFPTYMQNCSVCHNTPARLAAVMAKSQVSWALCMSCHNDWNGFPNTIVSGSRAGHRSYNLATDCGQCHTGNIATIAYFHDGLTTERDGVVVGGEDVSIKLGKKVKIVVKGVALQDGDVNTAVTWYVVDPTNATTYAPCNLDYGQGPVFFGWTGAGGEHSCTYTAAGCSSNFSILRAYAQGDDWVANLSTTRPGQPNSVNVTTKNTTCSGFDATTLVSTEATAATRAQLSIQGRAQFDLDPSPAATTLVWARSESPVYQYDPATGAALAARRQIVSNAKCLACHPGSLYQHGGTRIDSVELCIMCHNPASNDQNNRVTLGVDASEAYDGKKGQTYDLRTMIHAIHSAGESTVPLVIYRSSGVYAFGKASAIAALPHWPGASSTAVPVYGSTSSLPHNEILVHYPRSVGTCTACHVDGSDFVVDPAKAVAVTDEDAGAMDADPAIGWMDQADDVLVGPTTAACLSCHLGSNGKTKVEQLQLKAHAQQFSWQWAALGRSTLLDGSPIETCSVCHDATKHK